MSTTSLAGGESTLQDPTDLSRQDYLAAFKRTVKEVKDDDVPGLAAGVAFKMFLSIFPSLFAAVAIFSIVTTPAEIGEMLSKANAFLPGAAIELLAKPLDDLAKGGGSTAGFAALIGVLSGVFAATSAAISLMKALSRAYDVPETRKFVRQRLVGLALTVGLVAALVGVIVMLVLGPQIQDALMPGTVAPLSWLLTTARLAAAFVVLVVLFAFVYWIGPNRDHPSWVWMSPGALFGVVGWLLVSGGFTLYAQLSPSYNKTYGAIAGVAVLLVWLQLSMLVILVGAEFNAEIERTRARHLALDEGGGFAIPAPAGALVDRDQESGRTAVAEAQREAHADLPDAALDPLAPVPVPSAVGGGSFTSNHQVTNPLLAASSSGGARKNQALVLAGMAAAVFLGFARKRRRG